MREHNEAVNRLDFMADARRDHRRLPAPGAVIDVPQHDGSILRLRKTRTPTTTRSTASGACNYLHEHQAKGEIVTGLLYVEPEPEDLHAHLNTVDTPLNRLGAKELCPGAAALEKLNAALR